MNASLGYYCGALLLLCASGVQAADESPRSGIYHYRVKGRSVFVNGLQRVPEAHRKGAELVDLSGVSTNRALGNALQSQVSTQVGLMTKSVYCRGQRVEVRRHNWLSLTWSHHGYLILLAGASLLLIVLSPVMMRRFAPATWGKVLMVALPTLLFVTFLSVSVDRAGRAMGALRESAELCDPASYAAAAKPSELRQQLGRLAKLEDRIRAAQAGK